MKKLFALLLWVSVTAVLFSACGDNTKVSTGAVGDVPTVKIFSNIQDPIQGMENYEGNLKWKELAEQKAGVKLDFEVVPAANYKERLQIMLVSGDYPDVVKFGESSDKEFLDAVGNGIIVPVNKYLDNSPNIKAYTSQLALDSLKVKQDENIYGIPVTTLMRADGYVVRADWLDKVGLTIPQDGYVTLDEFYAILTAFTTRDPDGNGKDDTYGIGGWADTQKNFLPTVTDSFGLFGWQKSGGEYAYIDPKYDLNTDNYVNALTYNQKLFKEKLIEPDSSVTDSSGATNRFAKGITGVLKIFPGHLYTRLSDLRKINPNAKVAYIKGIKNNDGSISRYAGYGTGVWGFWSVTKANKNPDGITRFFDWVLSDEGWDTVVYGLPGESYSEENGVKKLVKGKEIKFAKDFLRRNNGIDFYLPVNIEEATEMLPALRKNLEESMDGVIVSQDRGFRPGVSNETKLLDAQKALEQTANKILIGGESPDKYKEALTKWYSAGGDRYVKEMNEYIKKFN